jgi:hypothetical protein
MDRKPFREGMAMLFTIFRQPIDTALADSYYLLLKDYSEEDFKRTVVEAGKTLKFFPSVAELIDILNGEECSEVEAKTDIIKAISRYGSYSTPKFKFQISHAIAEDIGWLNMCTMKEEELGRLIHFKYKNILEQWKRCKRDNTEFILPTLKGRLTPHGQCESLSEVLKKGVKNERT